MMICWPSRGRQPFGENAQADVGHGAGGKRDHDLDGTNRICALPSCGADARCRQRRGAAEQKLPACPARGLQRFHLSGVPFAGDLSAAAAMHSEAGNARQRRRRAMVSG
jgi:hypothetical protein